MKATLPALPSAAVDEIAHLVEARYGLRFTGSRRSELASKSAQAFADSGCPTWDAYCAQLGSRAGNSLLDRLVSDLTVGETYFFRHRAYFDLLEHELLPRVVAARREAGQRRLRFWSAGCATGEEAYSLAILLRRLLPDLESWDSSVLGTDLNRSFLQRAREGCYGPWSLRGSDAAFTATYFTPEGQRHRIKPWVADLVHFTQMNLADPVYPSPANGTSGLDLILCRNVLIYLAPDTAKQIVARLRAALVPGGWLVVGPSDPLPGLLAGFEPHGDERAIAYRKVEPAPPVLVAPEPRRTPPASLAPPPRVRAVRRDRTPLHPEPDSPPVRVEPDWPALWRAVQDASARGDLPAAETACQDAIGQWTLHPEPHYLLGILQQACDDRDSALVAFRKALYVDASFVPAHLALATLFRQAGAHERAQRSLARAQRLLLGRPDDEPILAEEPVTVGRLRQILDRALGAGHRSVS